MAAVVEEADSPKFSWHGPAWRWTCKACRRTGDWESFPGHAASAGEKHNEAKHPTVTERI